MTLLAPAGRVWWHYLEKASFNQQRTLYRNERSINCGSMSSTQHTRELFYFWGVLIVTTWHLKQHFLRLSSESLSSLWPYKAMLRRKEICIPLRRSVALYRSSILVIMKSKEKQNQQCYANVSCVLQYVQDSRSFSKLKKSAETKSQRTE
jgi:hypothetical protein